MDMKKVYLFLLAFVSLGFYLAAQSNGGSIKVTLVDKKNPKETIPFANVVVFNGKTQVAVATTDMDGNAWIRSLDAGKYNVKAVYVGYQPQQVNDVEVLNDKTAYLNLALSNEGGVVLDQVVVSEYKDPLIDPDTKSGGVVDRESFQHQAAKDMNSIISTQAGVILTDNGSKTSLQIRGSRPGNTNVFIDGERSIGTTNLPQSAVEQMSVVLGGLPAQYGDVTGGVVSVTTRGIQPRWFGGIEGISSGIPTGSSKNPTSAKGLDPYGYEFLGFSLGGPIISKKDSLKNKKPIIGFFMGGEINYQRDPRPWANGITQVNPDKLAQLQQTPLQYNAANQSYYPSAAYLTPSDLYTAKVRANVASTAIRLSPKIDFAITPNLTITLGGSIDYSNYHNFSIANALINSGRNPQVIENTMRGYLRLTQKFGSQNAVEQEKSQSVIKRAYFSFQAGYQTYKYVQQDEQFKKNFFDYGYVGKFDEKRVPIYALDSLNVKDPVTGKYSKKQVYELKGYRDSVINFTPSNLNPQATAYTSEVTSALGSSFNDLTQLQLSQGLRNGDLPANVQGLYSGSGTSTAGYSLRNNTIFRVTSNFSADIKNHALMVGVEYDQRVERGYDVNTYLLYNDARQLANQHNQTLGKDTTYYATQAAYQSASNAFNPNTAGNGTNNGLSTTQTNGAPITSSAGVVTFNTVNTNTLQSTFSKNFYDQIGVNGDHNPNSVQYINVDAVDPSQLSLKMFSPDELLNGGTQVVNAWGYDYSGNRLTSKVSFNDFLNKFHTDKFGDKIYDRNTAGFTPVYMAGYIQDKFDFKDIKFNVGVRVDRYDANQMVLSDPFLLKDAYNTSDIGSLGGQFTGTIPSSIPKGSTIYVVDPNAAVKTITGYRSGSTWYDATGAIVSDPKVIGAESGGNAMPWLKNPTDKSAYSNSAFTAYKPQINVMPRIAFSFPISDVANFFAHYDILTQRPPATQSDGANGAPYASYNRTNPQDYFFLSSNQGAVVGNGNLKPERTVDYELGFSQILNEKKSAVLKLSAFYREMRNQVQITRVNQAYPVSYITYGNIDFGTVKGFSAEFQLRRTAGFQLSANYTLQFAEGSGSNANGGYSLVNSSQPNLRVILPLDYDQRHTFTATLDYRFGEGKDYRGPQSTIKKSADKEQSIQWLKNFGINVVARLGSGLPYSQRTPAIADEELGNNPTQYLNGSLNGSRLPWQFRTDMRIDRNISNVMIGSSDKGDKRRSININIYLQVLNLFNNKNVVNVHSFTGSPKDDGYLTSAFGISELNAKYAQGTAYGQGFTTLYNAKLNDGRYYSAPRMIRLGVQVDF
jgi:hypothetical protein